MNKSISGGDKHKKEKRQNEIKQKGKRWSWYFV